MLGKRIACNPASEDKHFPINSSCVQTPAKSPEQILLEADFLFYSDTCSVRRKVPLAGAVLFSSFTLNHMLISFEGRLWSSTTRCQAWRTFSKKHRSISRSFIGLIKSMGWLLCVTKEATIFCLHSLEQGEITSPSEDSKPSWRISAFRYLIRITEWITL